MLEKHLSIKAQHTLFWSVIGAANGLRKKLRALGVQYRSGSTDKLY